MLHGRFACGPAHLDLVQFSSSSARWYFVVNRICNRDALFVTLELIIFIDWML